MSWENLMHTMGFYQELLKKRSLRYYCKVHFAHFILIFWNPKIEIFTVRLQDRLVLLIVRFKEICSEKVLSQDV